MTSEADLKRDRLVQQYFRAEAFFWKDVYAQSSLNGEIYRERRAGVLRLVDDRPVGLNAVVEVERGQPGVEGAGVLSGGGAAGGLSEGAEVAHGLAVVGVMEHIEGVGGEFGSHRDIQLACCMKLELGVGLIGVGPELLGEVGQRLIGPAIQRIGGVLMAVGASPLIPHAGAEDAEL